jgi:uncharacterized protein YaiE (UPF0345 family)
MSGIVYPNGNADVIIGAGGYLAIYTTQDAKVYQKTITPNQPTTVALLGVYGAGQNVLGPYVSGATLNVEAGAGIVQYAKGLSPNCYGFLDAKQQPTPGTLNATGTLTAALIQGGIVTSTTAAAVTATLDTGTVMDTSADLLVNDSFDWCAIATGANAFTVTASSGHTIVGSGVVATATSGHFRTRKTAANTYVTYRVS